jgi:phosphotransferase system, enzyme I, PtsP
METPARRSAPVALRVHPPVPSIAGFLTSLEPGVLSAPIRDVLAASCQQMSRLLGSDVVSVYVREPAAEGDLLVMQGNIGLSSEVVGNVRLRIGDGLVGWVAECLRPISVADADADPRFKPVRGIGEERFPVMVAQPVVRHRRCLGVLVFQRAAQQPFTDAELCIAGVLAEVTGLLLEAAERSRPADAGAQVGTEAVCLLGRPLSSGLGIGRVELIPTTEALAAPQGERPGRQQIADALARVERDLARLRGRLASPIDPLVDRALSRMELLLSDARLRERVLAERSLAGLARDYARASVGVGRTSRRPDQALVERAEGIGELCALLHVMATGGSLLQSGRIWIGRSLGPFFAAAATRGAAAVVLEGDGETPTEAAAIACAAGLPLLVGVRGLFAWTRPGDLLVVDGDRGVVRVNPSSSGLAAARSRSAERPRGAR